VEAAWAKASASQTGDVGEEGTRHDPIDPYRRAKAWANATVMAFSPALAAAYGMALGRGTRLRCC